MNKHHVGEGFAAKRAFLTICAFSVLCLVGAGAHADTLATTPGQLVGGYTTFHYADYENVYDASGNLLGAPATVVAGDTIQGVFVVDSVSSASGAVYSPDQGGVELTGVFDAYVSSATDGQLQLTPDNTSNVGGKAISGSAFQSLHGTGAMLALYSNNSDNMPLSATGNGLVGLTNSGAWTLATTNTVAAPGILWASFGQGPSETWGATSPPNPLGSGYYWGDNNTSPGVSAFAASLALITNDTGISSSLFAPIGQLPPSNSALPPNYLTDILNPFAIQGTTSPSNGNLTGTAFSVYSTDPAVVNVIPEPSTVVLLGVGAVLVGYGFSRRRLPRTAMPTAFDEPEPKDDSPAILSFASRTTCHLNLARRAA